MRLDLFHRIIIRLARGDLRNPRRFGPDDIIGEEQYSLDYLREHSRELWPGIWHVHSRHVCPTRLIFSPIVSRLAIKDIPPRPEDRRDVRQAFTEVARFFGRLMDHGMVRQIMWNAIRMAEMDRINFIIYLCTQGFAAHLLRECEIGDGAVGYEIDLLHMGEYEVRPGLVRYGCRLLLADTYMPISIETAEAHPETGESVFEGVDQNYAYNVLISTLNCYVTLIDHAVGVHFALAGHIYREVKMYGGEEVRTFLLPFLFAVDQVNTTAQAILVNPRGIAARLFAFTQDGLDRFLNWGALRFRPWVPAPGGRAPGGVNTPFVRDAGRYWGAIHRMCQEYVATIPSRALDAERSLVERLAPLFSIPLPQYSPIAPYPEADFREALAGIASHHIFYSSFFHEHVGNLSRYVIHPGIMRIKVFLEFPDEPIDTYQNTIQATFLALLTSSIKMPALTDELEVIWESPERRAIYARFRDRLLRLPIEVEFLRPNHMECSVSL